MSNGQVPAERPHTVPAAPRLSYTESGPDGPRAVVLLHSLGADRRMWRDQIAGLRHRYRVVAPDARGHGESGWVDPVDVHAWVADLRRVLDAAGVEDAALVGVSLGGIQAIAYAEAHPERVSALVVADSFVELPADVAAAKIAGLAGQAAAEGMTATAESYVADTFTRVPPPDGTDLIRTAIAGMDVHAYAESVRACFGARIADRLAGVRAPTLVLWGDADRKTPRALSERIAAGIDGAELRDVPAAGHLSNLENPAVFTRLIDGFVGRAWRLPDAASGGN
ncbi:MAG TPA: alpha/beta fold hydrolase [Streptosporangiaceae bacterium]